MSTDAPTLDLAFARAQFPAYDEGNPLAELAFFEAAGGSFPCRQVIDRLTRFYTHSKVQPGHPYSPALDGWDQMESTYARLATWMGVSPDEVVVGPSTTANTNTLGSALRDLLGPGDAVVITDQAHEANAGPFARLADAGVDVRIWAVDPVTGELQLDALLAVLDTDVAAVAFPQTSNLLGNQLPVAEVCAAIHEVGALAIVDGVAAAPHGLPWIDDLGADIYLFSTYKTYGPHQGVMVVRTDALEQLPNQSHFFNAEQPHKRLVPAGPDHAQLAAVQGVVDYLELLDAHHYAHAPDVDARTRNIRVHDLLRGAETANLRPLLAALAERDDVRVLGPTDPELRVPTVAMVLDRPAPDVAIALGARGVACGSGHFYSKRLTDAIGQDPTYVLRLSFTHTTAPWEIERALTELAAVLDAR